MSLFITSGKRFADLSLEEYEGKRYLHEDLGCIITVTKVDPSIGTCVLSFSNGNEPTGATPLFLLSHVEYLADV